MVAVVEGHGGDGAIFSPPSGTGYTIGLKSHNRGLLLAEMDEPSQHVDRIVERYEAGL